MYLYSDPTYPRTSLEKIFKQIHSLTNGLLYMAMIITIVDFYVRVDNTFVNYWGGGGIAMASDMEAILSNCSFDWVLDITTTNVDVHISYDSALIVGVITAAFIVGVLILTFILVLIDSAMKAMFLINVRYMRFRGVLFPLQTVLVSTAFVMSVGVIGAIAASDGSLRFMNRYVEKCSSEYNERLIANNYTAMSGNAFIEAELDSATVFGTNLYIILATAAFNLLGYIVAIVTRIAVNLSKTEGRLLAARMPYLKRGLLCVPDKLLLREYGIQRKQKLREMEINPMSSANFQPVLSGDVLVDEGDNDLTMAALIYDWTKDPNVDQSLLSMTEKDIQGEELFTEAEKTKLIAKRKELVAYVRQRQKDAIREIKRMDKEKRRQEAATDLRQRMNTNTNLAELFHSGAGMRARGGSNADNSDSLINSARNAGQPWVAAEELEGVDLEGEAAQELSNGEHASEDVAQPDGGESPRSNPESGGSGEAMLEATQESQEEGVDAEVEEGESAPQDTTPDADLEREAEDEEHQEDEDEARRRRKRDKKLKKDKKRRKATGEESHLNEDIPELDKDDDEPYYVYYDEDGNLLGEGSEFDVLGEQVDTLEQAMKEHREEKKHKDKKSKRDKKDKHKKKDAAGGVGLFAPPMDDNDIPLPPSRGPRHQEIDEEDAVPAPPPAGRHHHVNPIDLLLSPPPRQTRPSPDFETAIPIAPSP